MIEHRNDKEVMEHHCPLMEQRKMFIRKAKFGGYALNQETMHTGLGWLGYECKATGIEYCPYCGGKLE